MAVECSFPNCRRNRHNRGLCAGHASQRARGEELRELEKRAKKGTGHVTAAGYRVIVRDRRRILEHRATMEDALGRSLEDHERVHHINGDRLDNRIENLELWSVSQPAGQRIEDKIEWAAGILALYRPEMLARVEVR